MPHDPLRLIVLARDQSPRVQAAQRSLTEFLNGQADVDVVTAELTDELSFDGMDADLVVVLGGDGAILRACRQMGARQLPILGINFGRLGFLADLAPEEFQKRFELIRGRKYGVAEQLMFECVLRRADGSEDKHLGLNEVAVLAAGALEMIDIHLAIDGQDVATFGCDGLIVSTPVGSTAHSLSAGGPILRQDLQAFVITPICPHTLTVRPLVDSAERVFTLTIPQMPAGVTMVVDGQVKRPLQPGDTVEVRQAAARFKLARIPGHDFYSTLHRKLGWAGQPKYREL